ncbi:hypothetical protein, partial [Winogradskyella luteola]
NFLKLVVLDATEPDTLHNNRLHNQIIYKKTYNYLIKGITHSLIIPHKLHLVYLTQKITSINSKRERLNIIKTPVI